MKKVLFVVSVCLFLGLLLPLASGTCWNSSWERKQEINLTVASGSTPQNYQVLLNVTYDTDMQSDFDDLRFIDNDDSTLLDAWLENKSDENWATVWVEVNDSIGTGNTTIYMYYNNSGASATWDGNKTFLFFDDFEEAVINTSKWTESDTPNLITQVDGTLRLIRSGSYGSSNSDWGLTSKTNFNTPYVVETATETLDDYYSTGGHQHILYIGYTDATHYTGKISLSQSTTLSSIQPDINTSSGSSMYYPWNEWTIATQRTTSSNTSIELNRNGTLSTKTASTSTNTPMQFHASTGSQSTTFDYDIRWDWVFAREYAEPQPTSSFGTESGCVGCIIHINNVSSFTNDTTPTIDYTPTCHDLPTYCRLLINGTAYGDNSTSISNASNNYITANVSLADKYLSITVSCSNETLLGTSDLYMVTVDSVAPSVSITNPTNISYIFSQLLNFTYTENNTDTCWYREDSGSNYTIGYVNGTSLSASPACHHVELWCNDSAGNGDTAEVWYTLSSSWWNSNWDKRQIVYLSIASGSTPQNWQVLLNVTYDSDMQSNFDDLRFASVDGTSLFNHWIQNYTASSFADVWVQVSSSFSTAGGAVYMYYGNSSATDTSNVYNTLPLYDDFETTTVSWTCEDTTGVDFCARNDTYYQNGAWSWEINDDGGAGTGSYARFKTTSINATLVDIVNFSYRCVSCTLDNYKQVRMWWNSTNYNFFDDGELGSGNWVTNSTDVSSLTGNYNVSFGEYVIFAFIPYGGYFLFDDVIGHTDQSTIDYSFGSEESENLTVGCTITVNDYNLTSGSAGSTGYTLQNGSAGNALVANYTVTCYKASNYVCHFSNGTDYVGKNATALSNASLNYINTNVTWSDKNYSVSVNCTNGTFSNSSSITNLVLDTLAPSISLITPLNTNYAGGTDIMLNFTYIELNPANCTYSLDSATNVTIGYTNGTFLTSSAGSHTLNFWCNDSLAHIVSNHTGNFTINNPPLVSSVILSSTSALNFTDDDLAWYPTAFDSEGDAFAYAVNWYENDILQFSSDYDESLVGWWEFEKGKNTVCYDYSMNNNDGTFSGETFNEGTFTGETLNTGTLTNMEDASWVTGKYGYALDFDGVNDYVNCGSLNFSTGMSISAWVKVDTSNGLGRVIMKGDAGTRSFILYTSGDDVGCAIYHSSNGANTTSTWDGHGVMNNKWTLLTCTFDGTDLKLYSNETEIDSDVAAFPVIYESDKYMAIGRLGESNLEYFNGSIDDVRVYTRSLSQTEIIEIYKNNTFIRNGLVGYWRFDTGYGSSAFDTHHIVTDDNNASDYKFSNALSFDGVDDYVDLGQTAMHANHSSLSVWFRTSNAGVTQRIYARGNNPSAGNSFALQITADNIRGLVGGQIAGGGGLIIGTNEPINSNQWYHAGLVFNGDTNRLLFYLNGSLKQNDSADTWIDNASNMNTNIGIQADNTGDVFNGSMDDFRVWNRSLSPTEVLSVYNDNSFIRTDLLGYWRFDEASGVTAEDTHIHVYPDNNASDFKMGRAVSFDGVNDYILGPTTNYFKTNDFTVSVWINVEDRTNYQYVIHKRVAATRNETIIRIHSNDKIELRTDNTGNGGANIAVLSNTTIQDNTWHHITGVRNGTSLYIYIDGIKRGTTIGAVQDLTTSTSLQIGRFVGDAYYLNGSIDDARVYNRALSDSEVSSSYNATRNGHGLPSSLTSIGDSWIVGLIPVDQGGLRGAEVNSSAITIDSNPPVVSANSTAPGTVYTVNDVVLNVTCYDVNAGETLTVYVTDVFLNDSSLSLTSSQVVGNNTNTLVYTLGSGNYTKDDKIKIQFLCGDSLVNTSNYNTTEITIANTVPTIDDVKTNGEDAPSVNPTEGTDTVATITFNVTDADGTSDINLTSAYANDTTDSIVNTSCIWGSYSDSDTKEIKCELSLHYYTTGEVKSLEVYVEDNSASSTSNNVHGFTYNIIYTIALNTSSIDFGIIDVNTDNNAISHQLNNTGNGIIDVTIKASNMENGSSVLEIGNCTVDDDSIADEGDETNKNEMCLTTNAQDFSPVAGVAVQATLDWWYFLDIPSNLVAGKYSSASDWEIVSSQH